MTDDINSTSVQERWRPFASFVVEFQVRALANQKPEERTKVHHIETDTCAAWPVTEQAQLCQWMMAHLSIHPA